MAKVVFHKGRDQVLGGLWDNKDSFVSEFTLLGKPLISYNIEKIASIEGGVTHVMIPEGFRAAAAAISESLPAIQLDEYPDDGSDVVAGGSVEFPLDSVMVKGEGGRWMGIEIRYPWHLLEAMTRVMDEEVKQSSISDRAYVSRTSVVSGPCIIEDGAFIDDFCKIKGPAYIGRDTRVGTSSLVRNSIVGRGCTIGFNCEVGKCYFANDVRIAHQNVVLDSVLGRNVWMGGFVGTTNVLLSNENVRFKVGETLVDTGVNHLGAIIAHDCCIGAGVIFLPGRSVPPNSIVQAGVVFASPGDVLRRAGHGAPSGEPVNEARAA